MLQGTIPIHTAIHTARCSAWPGMESGKAGLANDPDDDWPEPARIAHHGAPAEEQAAAPVTRAWTAASGSALRAPSAAHGSLQEGAAVAGHSGRAAMLGVAAARGSGAGGGSSAAAAAALHTAAASGDADAAFVLGVLGSARAVAAGFPGLPGQAEAVGHFETAAAGGHAGAAYAAACHYHLGAGVAVDQHAARRLSEQAAVEGLAPAQHLLATILEDGAPEAGMAPDPGGAATWYAAAAQQGHALAQNAVGELLMVEAEAAGQRVPEEAVAQWRAAAAQGLPDAAYNLGSAVR